MSDSRSSHEISERLGSYTHEGRSSYYVDYVHQTSSARPLYNGQYSTIVDCLREIRGAQLQKITDPLVEEFVQIISAVAFVTNLGIIRSQIHLGLLEEAHRNWPEAAPAIRVPLSNLVVKKFEAIGVEIIEATSQVLNDN